MGRSWSRLDWLQITAGPNLHSWALVLKSTKIARSARFLIWLKTAIFFAPLSGLR